MALKGDWELHYWEREFTDIDDLIKEFSNGILGIIDNQQGKSMQRSDYIHRDYLVNTHNGNMWAYVTQETIDKLIATGQFYWDKGNLRYMEDDITTAVADYDKGYWAFYRLPGERDFQAQSYDDPDGIDEIARSHPGIPVFNFVVGYYWGNVMWTQEGGLVRDKAEFPHCNFWPYVPNSRSYKSP